VTDVIVVVVIVAFFTATALLVPALSRLTADSAAGETDDTELGADSRSDIEVRS
jgi:hypothetical protein